MATQQFHDFLNNGCQVRLAVALDFTGWHVDSRQRQRRRVPPTPHSSPADTRKGTGGEWDDYEQAILTVGSILAQLDPDHARIPVWGFGAKYNHIVRACFQCDPKYKVEGTQGIIKAFRGVLQNPKCMSYQSKFTNVISMAANYARHEQVRTAKGVAPFSLKQTSLTLLMLPSAPTVGCGSRRWERIVHDSCNLY